MTPAELRAVDCIGLPRFTPQQAKAIVDRVRKTGALVCEPPACEGSGIVIAGGGRYLSWSWVLMRKLRSLGCQLPVQIWHLGPREMPANAKKLFAQMDAETVDTHEVMMKHPVREMSGWIMKTYAVRHCPWRHVMFIDADCMAEVNPEEVFNDTDVRKHGSLFFNDVGSHHDPWAWVDCSLLPPEKELETGQFLWDKQRAWMALRWAMWASEHASDVFYRTFHGDKGVIQAALMISQSPHMIGEKSEWEGYGIGHYLKGRKVFSHRMAQKRGEWPMDPWMQALFDEFKTFRF